MVPTVESLYETARRLAVCVRDENGRAVPRAHVAVREDTEKEHWFRSDDESSTGADGVARFHAIAVDRIAVRVLATGFREARRVVELEPDTETRFQVFLQPGGRMCGRIVDRETGRPLVREGLFRGFVTRSVIDPRFDVRGIPHLTIIDAQGRVRHNGLHPGSAFEEKARLIDALLEEKEQQ